MQAMPSAYDKNEEQQLRQRIQALAQELQDLIFDFTTAVETDQVITIDETYRTPKGFRINSKTRKARARQYYSTNAFLLTSDYPLEDFPSVSVRYFDDMGFCKWWLKTLPPEYGLMIRDIRIPLWDMSTAFLDARPDYAELHTRYGRSVSICIFIWACLTKIARELEMKDISLGTDCLKSDWKKTEGDALKWLSAHELNELKFVLKAEHEASLNGNQQG